MAFRIDDISIHLMPPPDKDEKGDRGRHTPRNDEGSHQDDQGQACTMATATPYMDQVQKKECPGTKDSGAQALAFLRGRLRETVAPPPL